MGRLFDFESSPKFAIGNLKSNYSLYYRKKKNVIIEVIRIEFSIFFLVAVEKLAPCTSVEEEWETKVKLLYD